MYSACWSLCPLVILLQEGGHSGAQSELLSNLPELEINCQGDKERHFIEGAQVEQRERDPKELFCPMACNLRFYGHGVSFPGCLWLIILTLDPSIAQLDGFQQRDCGRLVGHMDCSLLSPFDLFQVLPASGSLLIPHSLAG